MIRHYPIVKILRQLKRADLLPAIVFRSARKDCDTDLTHLSAKPHLGVTEEVRAEIIAKVEEICAQYDWSLDLIRSYDQYETLINHAAGAHHAGQLLNWRMLLEELMSRGVLRLLIATGTVAAGVDFPARSVVISAHSKRGNDGFNVLKPSELQQMSGRAGRRGKDSVGFCMMAPSQYCDARVLAEVAKTPPEPLVSSYYASASSVLNLLKYRSVQELNFVVNHSLAAFIDREHAEQQKGTAEKMQRELDRIPTEQQDKKAAKKVRREFKRSVDTANKQEVALENTLNLLTGFGYIKDDVLTGKGIWSAELCTNLVLELGEAIDAGLLEKLSTPELVGAIASICGDSYRTYLKVKQSVVKKEVFKGLTQIVERINEATAGSCLEQERSVLPAAAATVETWLKSDDWGEFSALLKLSGVTAGDASRIITQTADQLQQMTRISDSHPELAEQAQQARELLLRPPLNSLY